MDTLLDVNAAVEVPPFANDAGALWRLSLSTLSVGMVHRVMRRGPSKRSHSAFPLHLCPIVDAAACFLVTNRLLVEPIRSIRGR